MIKRRSKFHESIARAQAKAKAKAKPKAKPKAGLKEVVKSLIGKKEKEELCDKEGCERPAVECEGHVDCNPCEDK